MELCIFCYWILLLGRVLLCENVCTVYEGLKQVFLRDFLTVWSPKCCWEEDNPNFQIITSLWLHFLAREAHCETETIVEVLGHTMLEVFEGSSTTFFHCSFYLKYHKHSSYFVMFQISSRPLKI
jgi:hypothetical protein